MEPIEITTPSGYKVYVKPNLNYGQFLDLQEYIMSKVALNPKTGIPDSLPGSVLIAGNRKALELLVIRVCNPQGADVPNPVQAVLDFEPDDGNAVMNKINEITQKANLLQKKGA